MLAKPHLLAVGNNNFINADRLIAVSTLKAASVRRTVEEAKANGLLLDFTGALTCQGICIFDTGIVIRIAMRPRDVMAVVNALD